MATKKVELTPDQLDQEIACILDGSGGAMHLGPVSDRLHEKGIDANGTEISDSLSRLIRADRAILTGHTDTFHVMTTVTNKEGGETS